MSKHLRLFAVGLCALLGAAPISAATIGYWRMEQDIDARPANLRVANEVAGNDMTSTTAFVDTALPTTSVPLTGSSNLGSVGSTTQGGSAGINGTVAAYAALNVPSITVEFWARTVENQAELFLRSTGNNGLVIENPSSLDVTFWVEDGFGGATSLSMLDLYDLDSNWHHFAFTYDHVAGLGEFFVDATRVSQVAGTPGRALVWDPAAPVRIGLRMDYAAAFNGTMDEVRIDDNALPSGDLLLTPEPETAVLVTLGLMGLAWAGRPRRPPSA